MATNRNFGKLVNGALVNAPDALVIVTTTTEDYEECVNAEAVETDGAEPVYEHRTREVVTRRVELHPTASEYANPNAHSYYDDSDVGPWLPIDRSAPNEPAPDGKHWDATGWLEQNGVIRRVFALVDDPPPPPRTFSKLRAIAALKAAGVWAQVKAWIETEGLMDEYLAAQDFKEDNEYFVRGLGALKAQLGWSDEQAEAVLSQCVAQ